MQTTPLGLLGAAAAVPLAQRHSDADPAQHAAAAHARQTAAEKQAESAAGIGQTDGDEPAADRDADGRRLWEAGRHAEARESEEPPSPSTSKDPTGATGGQLDLSG